MSLTRLSRFQRRLSSARRISLAAMGMLALAVLAGAAVNSKHAFSLGS
jgi:hypothetical protein